MSLYTYCKKANDGEQKSHCKTKCINCISYIAGVKAVWKDRGYGRKNLLSERPN
jgi:hypothetical protein